MKLRLPVNTPWREHLPRNLRFCHFKGRMVYDDSTRHIDPDRPMEWHEIVRGDRVVMRSRKPVERLLKILSPGEKLYRVKRNSKKSGVTDVSRRRVA